MFQLRDLIQIKTFQAGFSCVPFWLSESNVCPDLVHNSSSFKDAFAHFVFQNFIGTKRGFLSTPAEKRCSKPCKKMTIIVKNRGNSKFKNFNRSQLIFEFNPTYELKSKVLAYDGFDFIVDTGSSLGLWIGQYRIQFNEIRNM